LSHNVGGVSFVSLLMKQIGKSQRLRTAAAFLLLLAAIPLVGNVDPKKGRVTENPTSGNSYSIEQEVDYGRQAVPVIQKELPLLPVDHPVSKYINALGQRLAAKAPGYKFPYTFRVVNQKEINAFALPGGPIYVNTGTIAAANEAELAGVMGHEISHVVMRHSTRQASRQTRAAVPLAILSGVLGAGVGGWAGSLAQMGISIGAGSVFTKYSRDAETEADMVGAQIIYDAGYDPHAMVTFFQKLKAQQGDKSGPSFLASHPDPGNRAQNVSSILSRFPAKQYQSGDSPDFLAAKKALDKVGPQSVAEAQVAIPSFELRRLSVKELSAANFENYDHGAFRVAYPGNWQLIGNPNSSLTIYPKGGANSTAVCYGTIISGFTPNSRGKQLDDAMRQLINGIRDTNPGLRPAGNPVNISVGARAAKSVEMLGTSAIRQNGEPLAERIRLVALQGRGSLVLYMVFVAPDGDFDSMRPTFDRIMRSFTAR
jgi:Zn-dependent protease with chaperone function